MDNQSISEVEEESSIDESESTTGDRYILSGSLMTVTGVDTTVRAGRAKGVKGFSISSKVSCLIGDLSKQQLYTLAIRCLIIAWQASIRTKFKKREPLQTDLDELTTVTLDGAGKSESEGKVINALFVGMMTESPSWRQGVKGLSEAGQGAFKKLCEKAHIDLEAEMTASK